MISKIAQQQQIEKLYNKNQTISRIKTELIEYNNGEVLEYINETGLKEDFALDLLTQMILHKRCDLPTLVGTLKRHAENSLQDVVDGINVALDYNLLSYDEMTQKFIVNIDISPEVQLELDTYQYPFPMIIPPNVVKNNRSSGYLTIDTPIILKNNTHDDDVVLDHINRANSVPFRINADVAHFIQNKWKNIDKKKEGETIWEFQKRKRAFDKYDQTAKAVIDMLNEVTDVIYFTHRYDFRGRIYCQGYHLNYAGNAWNKACVELYNQEPLNPN